MKSLGGMAAGCVFAEIEIRADEWGRGAQRNPCGRLCPGQSARQQGVTRFVVSLTHTERAWPLRLRDRGWGRKSMRVVTGEEMRVIEQRAMAELEVSGLLLMETAVPG